MFTNPKITEENASAVRIPAVVPEPAPAAAVAAKIKLKTVNFFFSPNMCKAGSPLWRVGFV